MSTGNLAEPPFFNPASGRIVRQTGPDTAEAVHEGLMFPIAMEIGPDGAFYVSTPAIGANDGSGAILRFDAPMTDTSVPAASAPADTAATDTAAAECTPIEGTTGPMPAPPGSAPAEGAATSEPAAAPASSAPAAAETTVVIEGFAFRTPELSVAAGTTVTFINNDTAPHTATGDGFDTGEIAPGRRRPSPSTSPASTATRATSTRR